MGFHHASLRFYWAKVCTVLAVFCLICVGLSPRAVPGEAFFCLLGIMFAVVGLLLVTYSDSE